MKNFVVYNGGVKLFFGLNTISSVEKFLIGKKKMLIVTGRSSAERSGALNDIINILDKNGVEYVVWNRAEPNPSDRLVYDLVETWRNSVFDGFIAIGGGSVIDLVKACRVVVSSGGDIRDYLYGFRKPVDNQYFMLAVNLTHGTGSEIDRYSVITIEETMEKIGFNAGYPTVSIDDPKYTITLPLNQSIYVTMDAFAHAVESATSIYSSPYTELLALETTRLIIEYLPKLVRELGNVEYRYWLLYASMLGGIGIDHGSAHIGHFIEHLLSGYNPKLPHGAGLAILYRKLVELIYRENPDTTCKLLKPLNPGLKPYPDYSIEASKSYNEFLDSIGFREKLSDYGFSTDSLRDILNLYDRMWSRFSERTSISLTKESLRELLNELI
uniref:Iron-containing alcohol dehydrogenase n=1 Tax=Staphylothermus marinus TaxID=2280 RepID=A0A7C4DB37_STAMA